MITINEITAPNTVFSIRERFSLKIFMAGGISGCRDWQRMFVNLMTNDQRVKIPELIQKPSYPDVTLYNPRRPDFNIYDRDMEDEQVSWEYEHLDKADIISFWFSDETVQPITLFELGKAIGSGKVVFIGRHDDYERASDIETQLALAGFRGKIHNSLEDLTNSIMNTICYGKVG